jgi:hypothetical protein
MLDGRLRLGTESLDTGDAAKLAGPEELTLTGTGDTELIRIEVPLEFQPIGVWPGSAKSAPAGTQGAARTAADAWRAATRMGSQTGENGGA